jgi:hypothetical protein
MKVASREEGRAFPEQVRFACASIFPFLLTLTVVKLDMLPPWRALCRHERHTGARGASPRLAAEPDTPEARNRIDAWIAPVELALRSRPRRSPPPDGLHQSAIGVGGRLSSPSNWLHEIKRDGYRTVCVIQQQRQHLHVTGAQLGRSHAEHCASPRGALGKPQHALAQ